MEPSVSSSPPPPPPPPPPPSPQATYPPQNVRWAQQTARQQRRAAALAARQQRDLLRAQIRATRRTSVLGPVLLVGTGLVLLLLQLGHLQWASTFAFLATWWPLLLVGAGLILLGEWLFDTHVSGGKSVGASRHRVGAGGIIILTLLMLIGPVASGISQGSDWARSRWDLPESWGLEQFFAQHSETTQELNASLSRGALLTIGNFHGKITVTGSSQDGQVHVSAHQRLSAWQAEDLRRRETRDKPTLTSSGTGLLLRAEGEGRDQTDLTVEVPHEAALSINPEQGDLEISELRGNVTVADHTGNVVLTALTGDVHLNVRDDDADVSGHSLSGNLTLEGRSGDVSFSDVTGPVTLRGDFFGTTHLERLQGPVHFQSSFTEFACAGVPGEISVEGRSEFKARNLIGPVTLTTTDRDIEMNDIHHGATITNRKGSVKLSFLDLVDPVSVMTTDGTIKLQVPAQAALRLTAETADGQIENSFGLKPVHQDDRVTLSGQVRVGGPSVRLQTDEGDIKIRKTDTPDRAGTAPSNDEDKNTNSDN